MEIKHPEMQDIPAILEKRDKDWSAKIVPADTEPRLERIPSEAKMEDTISKYCNGRHCRDCIVRSLCNETEGFHPRFVEEVKRACAIIKEEMNND